MGAGRGSDGLTPLLRRVILALALLATWVLAAGCQLGTEEEFAVKPVQPAPALEAAQASGEVFRLSEEQGRVVLVTFGYTSCPDVCPTTLAQLSSLERRLSTKGKSVDVVFVSVDPERDSAQRLEDYVHFFSARFTALHLEGKALESVLSAYHVTATKRFADALRYSDHTETEPPSYTVNHTGGYFVIDKRGELRLHLPYDVTIERLQDSVERLLSESTSGPGIQVERARARLTPAQVGAVYLTLVNASWKDDRLLSAETSSAERVELHEVQAQEGVLAMLPRSEGFAIPAGGRVELMPGGKHLMLYKVRDAASGIDLKLHFERSGVVPVRVPLLAMDQDAR